MDIVEALRTEEYAIGPYRKGQELFADYLRERRAAATEITQLREQVEVMRVALEAIAGSMFRNDLSQKAMQSTAREALAKVKEVGCE